MRPLLATTALLATSLLPTLAGCDREAAQAGSRHATTATAASAAPSDGELLARGEYLVRIAGCNDCHTPGYAESAGSVPKSQWLVGSPVGWNGPWGTTYPANLRTKVQAMDEAAWLQYSGTLHTRPPMPDFALRTMHENDRLAIHRFIRSLGPGGTPAPAYLPPGEPPHPPYVQWVLPARPAASPPAG